MAFKLGCTDFTGNVCHAVLIWVPISYCYNYNYIDCKLEHVCTLLQLAKAHNILASSPVPLFWCWNAREAN